MAKKFIRLLVLWTVVALPFVLFFTGSSASKRSSGRVSRGEKRAEKEFVVVIPSYNNAKYCEQNLLSILGQDYNNFRVIYVDDASTDETWEKVERLVNQSKLKDRVTLIHREKNVGSLANLYEVINSCHDNEIVVRVDGDDFLAHPFVLKKLNKVYSEGDVWMTYGNYLDYPSYKQNPQICEELPSDVIRKGNFRNYKWVTSHLQTFYAGLFKKIQKESLMRGGVFLPMAGDLAFIMPLLEMAGSHTRYIHEVLYLYNRINPISDHKKNLNLQSQCEGYVRSLPSYEKLGQF